MRRLHGLMRLSAVVALVIAAGMWLGAPTIGGWWAGVGVASAVVLLVDATITDRRHRRQHPDDGPQDAER